MLVKTPTDFIYKKKEKKTCVRNNETKDSQPTHLSNLLTKGTAAYTISRAKWQTKTQVGKQKPLSNHVKHA